jgi:DNA (cytosine-5)-methyltransferase 1
MRRAYYNDSDPRCCAWLRELVRAGLIPEGDVDGRPIQEVQAADVMGYGQRHWFTGGGQGFRPSSSGA